MSKYEIPEWAHKIYLNSSKVPIIILNDIDNDSYNLHEEIQAQLVGEYLEKEK